MAKSILIADSGSTKTDWRYINSTGHIHQFSSQGLNPYFHTSIQVADAIRAELLPSLMPLLDDPSIQLFFYGSGCGNESSCKIISDALVSIFPKASICIYSDLLAAAHGLCGHSPGIAGILGTGMNSCLFDGKTIVSQQPSLGYILGDEGSGAYFGKRIVSDYFNREMPEIVRTKFESRFSLTLEDALRKVYKEPNPNRFLASFSKFVYQNISEPYCVELVATGFRRYFELHICRYDAPHLKFNCTGSVAFWYSNILRRIAEEKGILLGTIAESPIAGLTLYYTGEH
ncbi:MAG TPA: N-acetylglucosamine kinase [Bacteroidia bacterium]|jgi:N-acetylglucosamine kinase-like BadF-type ATPase|nr:N-acetylglucosamine kinase [Bacteroidia bacterium]